MRRLTIRNIERIRSAVAVGDCPHVRSVTEADGEYYLLTDWSGHRWSAIICRLGDRNGWKMAVTCVTHSVGGLNPQWVQPITMGDVTRPAVFLRTMEYTFDKILKHKF